MNTKNASSKKIVEPTTTPPPWRVERSPGRVSVVGPEGKEIARVFHPPAKGGGNRADSRGLNDRDANAERIVTAVNGQADLVKSVRALFYLVHSLQASEGATPELVRSVTGHAALALRAVGTERLPVMVDCLEVDGLADLAEIMPQFPPAPGMPEVMGL